MPSRVDLSKIVSPKATPSAERSSVRYGTAQTPSANGRVTVLCDGSDEAVVLSTSETIAQGQRVSVVSQGGTWKAVCLGAGSIGGAMIGQDAAFDDVIASTILANVVTTAIINAIKGNFDEITTNVINAVKGNFGQIDANVINSVVANLGTVNSTVLNAIQASITQAFADSLMVQSRFISQSGTVYDLVSVHIDAGSITTGTLTVDRLVVQGADGEYYLVEPDGKGSTKQTKLEGSALKKNSVAADRIIADSITTREITAQNLVGTGGWINLRNGTFLYSNASTGDSIGWDGQHLTVKAESLNALFGGGNLLIDGDAPSLDAKDYVSGRYVYDGTATSHAFSVASDANRQLTGAVNIFRWSWAAGTAIARNTASNFRFYSGTDKYLRLTPGQCYHLSVWSYANAAILRNAGAKIRCSIGLAAAETLSGNVEMCYGEWQELSSAGSAFKKFEWDVVLDGVVPKDGVSGYRVTFYVQPNSSDSEITPGGEVRVYLCGFSMRTESSYLSVDGEGLHVKTDGTSEALLDGSGLHVKGTDGGTLADFVGTGMTVYDSAGTQQLAASGTRGLRKRNTVPHSLMTESDTLVTEEPGYAVMGGVLLYVNSSGSAASITLQRTKADFAVLEFEYGDGTRFATKRLYCSTTGAQTVALDRIVANSTTAYMGSSVVTVSGKNVTWGASNKCEAQISGTAAAFSAASAIKIYRVIGWT